MAFKSFYELDPIAISRFDLNIIIIPLLGHSSLEYLITVPKYLLFILLTEVVLKGERPSNVAFAATVMVIHGCDLGNDSVDSVIDEVGLGGNLVKVSALQFYYSSLYFECEYF